LEEGMAVMLDATKNRRRAEVVEDIGNSHREV
jgi:hypothetical protein